MIKNIKTLFILLAVLFTVLLSCKILADEINIEKNDPVNNPLLNLMQPGDYKFEITHNNINRYYLLHIPESHDKLMPLVFVFHGRMGSAEIQANDEYYGWISKSNKEGFVVAFPNGASKFSSGKFASWNAGDCCGYAQKTKSDDVGFIKKVINEIKNKSSIDSRKIYTVGMSNGARFSYRLACEMPDVFNAIGAVAGTEIYKSCNPSDKISIIHIHALDDPEALFAGGVSAKGIYSTGVEETIARWVKRNNCKSPYAKTLDKEGAHCVLYDNCDDDVKIKLCTTNEGKHSWPGAKTMRFHSSPMPSNAISATDEIWNFFKEIE